MKQSTQALLELSTLQLAHNALVQHVNMLTKLIAQMIDAAHPDLAGQTPATPAPETQTGQYI